MAKIKICGLQSIDDIDCVNKANCDYAGFIFAESRRKISFDLSLTLRKKLKKSIKSVGVFVNETIDNIRKLCDIDAIDIVQLHGNENNEYISQLKLNINKPIIKSFKIKELNDVFIAKNSIADYILFDTYHEKLSGGTGKTFNWDLIKDINRDYFLAGGLNYGNVPMAFFKLKPYAFDVSSGVEIDGVKDCKKISEIVSLVRSLN